MAYDERAGDGVPISRLGWRDSPAMFLVEDSGGGPNGSVYFRIDSYHHRIELMPSGEDDLLHTGWEVRGCRCDAACGGTTAGAGRRGHGRGSEAETAARRVIGLIPLNAVLQITDMSYILV